MTRLETTLTHPEPFTTKAGRVVCAAVVVLATACGGSSDPTPAIKPAPPPGIAYSVVVKTVDTQGQPISSVGVDLNGGFNGMTARTGNDGTTKFDFNARSSDAFVGTYMTGYHRAGRRFQLAGASGPIVQQLTLMRSEEAQLVVNSVTSEMSADASSVVVSADIGASDRNGNPIATLTAADFTVPAIDCLGFGFPCILEPSGAASLTGWWYPPQRSLVEVTPSGVGASTHYKVRYVLEAVPGTFTAGRTALTYLDVRVGADTSLSIQVDVRL